jgi:hypothetical protein
VETGQLTLSDIRDLESTLEKLDANRRVAEDDPQRRKSARGERPRGGSAK